MIEENAEGRHQFQAPAFEFVNTLFPVGPVGEFFGAENFVASGGISYHLKLAVREIQINPVARTDGGEASAIERFRHDMSDGNPIMLECDTPVSNQNAHGS